MLTFLVFQKCNNVDSAIVHCRLESKPIDTSLVISAGTWLSATKTKVMWANSCECSQFECQNIVKNTRNKLYFSLLLLLFVNYVKAPNVQVLLLRCCSAHFGGRLMHVHYVADNIYLFSVGLEQPGSSSDWAWLYILCWL